MARVKNVRWSYYNGTWTAFHRDNMKGQIRLVAHEVEGHHYVITRRNPNYSCPEFFRSLEDARNRLMDLIREANP